MDKKQLTGSIREILKIDSSEKKAEKGKPFGDGAYRALNYFLDLAGSFGLKTKNYENYAGEVILEGETAEAIAVLCHLDVVPAGGGWKHPPFGGEEHGGRLYGRGATDNKGPAVVCLYALKELFDQGFKGKKTVKLIVGCDEESGWECIKYYNKHAQMPQTGFSPDAVFPVIYAEKGILHIEAAFECKNIKSIAGGTAPNMVCDYVAAECEIDAAQLKRFKLKEEDGRVVSRGKSAHGSTPEDGKNALLPMLKYLQELGCVGTDAAEFLFEDAAGLKKLKDQTGSLTISPNMIALQGGKLNVTVDIRYPASLEESAVTALIERAGVTYKKLHSQPPLYIEKDDRLVTTLLKIYNEETGLKQQPSAIGGGTYARALKKGVAFGPEFSGDKSGVHQSDEFIELSRLDTLFKIYYRAIKELSNLE